MTKLSALGVIAIAASAGGLSVLVAPAAQPRLGEPSATRVCVGPARLDVAGVTRAHLSFGGPGCSANRYALFGVKRVPLRAAPSSRDAAPVRIKNA